MYVPAWIAKPVQLLITMSVSFLAFLTTPGMAQNTSADLPRLSGGECIALGPDEDGETDRLAFVVGNGSYLPDIGWLENAPNDAAGVAAMALGLGFRVYAITEATSAEIASCLDKAVAETGSADIALFHYSGHGVQVADDNYIVPIDARAVTLDRPEEMLEIDALVDRLTGIAATTVALIDACRNFTSRASRGLAATTVADDVSSAFTVRGDRQLLYLFATQPGNVASDRGAFFSPFTEAVVTHLPAEGQTLAETVVTVTRAVGEATDWSQLPFTRMNLAAPVYLNRTMSMADLQGRSRLLAAESQDALKEGRTEDALVLAAAGLPDGIASADLEASFEHAVRALRHALYAPPIRVPVELGQSSRIEISPNGRHALTGTDQAPAGSYVVHLIELPTQEVVWRDTIVSGSYGIDPDLGFAFSPDGTKFLLERGRIFTEVRDSATGQLVSSNSIADPSWIVGSDSGTSLESWAWSEDSAAYGLHYRVDWEQRLRIHDAGTGEVRYSPSDAINRPRLPGASFLISRIDLVSADTGCFVDTHTFPRQKSEDPERSITHYGVFDLEADTFEIWHSEADLNWPNNNVRCSPDREIIWYEWGRFSDAASMGAEVQSGLISRSGDHLTVSVMPDYNGVTVPIFGDPTWLAAIDYDADGIDLLEFPSGTSAFDGLPLKSSETPVEAAIDKNGRLSIFYRSGFYNSLPYLLGLGATPADMLAEAAKRLPPEREDDLARSRLTSAN